MTVPYSFANATVSIPLSQLDANFNTPITLGNTAIQLGNTVTTLNNMTLANVTISSGNVTITNVSVTTANVTTANITNMVSGNVTITGGSINGTTLGATTASTANVTTLTTSSTVTINGGTANGVAYLNGSKVLTTGSALTFDGTNLATTGSLGVGAAADATHRAYVFAAGNGIARLGNSTTDVNLTGVSGVFGTNVAQFGGQLAWSLVGSEQMRLTSTGLGIGTSSPNAKLTVGDSSGAVLGIPTTATFYGTSSISSSVGTVGLFSTETAAADVGPILTFGGKSGNSFSPYPFAFIQGAKASATAGDYSGYLRFLTVPSDGSGPVERLRINASGNLGLGVTPSAWGSDYRAVDAASGANGGGAFSGFFSTSISRNCYNDNTNWRAKYSADERPALYAQPYGGGHQWFNGNAFVTAGGIVAMTQAMTLDANGSLAVGGTTVVTNNGGITATTTVSGSVAATLAMRNAGTGNGSGTTLVFRGVSNASAEHDYAYVAGVADDTTAKTGSIRFSTTAGSSPVERARITSGGVLDIGTGAGAVGQIQFPATQVASSNANTLDDYEEGTWTATLTDGTNTTTSTGANYRKIGSLVFLSFQFYDKDISAWNAANLSVTGLPFTVATNHDSFVTVGTPNGFTVSGPLTMLFSNGSTSSGLYYRGGGSNYAGVQKGDITNNSNFSLYLSGCYTAS
jgi:hypothetical protein